MAKSDQQGYSPEADEKGLIPWQAAELEDALEVYIGSLEAMEDALGDEIETELGAQYAIISSQAGLLTYLATKYPDRKAGILLAQWRRTVRAEQVVTDAQDDLLRDGLMVEVPDEPGVVNPSLELLDALAALPYNQQDELEDMTIYTFDTDEVRKTALERRGGKGPADRRGK